MKAFLILVALCCSLLLASASPFFGLAKVKTAKAIGIKYKLNPHLGFAKYNAIRYEPVREAQPAVEAAPVETGPYPPQF